MIAQHKAPEDEVNLRLVTAPDEWNNEEQVGNLTAVQEAARTAGIQFDWECDAAWHRRLQNTQSIGYRRGSPTSKRLSLWP